MRHDTTTPIPSPDSAFFALPPASPANDSMLRSAPVDDPGEHCDRRRKLRAETVRRLLEKAAHLPARDRALVELVLRDGRSCAQIAHANSPHANSPHANSPHANSPHAHLAHSSVPHSDTTEPAGPRQALDLPLPHSDRSAIALRRRVRRLVHRIQSREYAYIVAHRAEWTRSLRSVATACWIEGLSTRAAAQRLRMSLYEVRRSRAAVLAIIQTAPRRAADAPRPAA